MTAREEGWWMDDPTSCEKTRVTVRLTGDSLDPDSVTAALAIEPEFAARKGMRESKHGRTVLQRTGVWYITTNDLASLSLERHLRHALDKIEPKREELTRLTAEQEIALDFGCYWVSAMDQPTGPVITTETLARIAALDASLGFNFAYYG